jgi:peptidoglycan glycosyltransferase
MRVRNLDRRRVLLVLAALVVGAGLAAGERIADATWLLLLGAGWLLFLVATWPRVDPRAPVTVRTTLHLTAFFAAAFAALAVQAVRTQVVLGRAIGARTGTDPETGDVLADPRRARAARQTARGRILDRTGRVLAESVEEPDGFRRVVVDPAVAPVTGYFSPLRYGATGLEAAFADELSGTGGPGALRRELDRLLGRPPRGLDLRLSLDLDLQRLAFDLLAGRPGAAVLLDARTGATLALASAPMIDPNRLAAIDEAGLAAAASYWESIRDDPAAPLLPRPVAAALTPGSVFKVVTAATAVAQGIADPDTVYEDAGELEVDGRTIPEFNRPDDTRTEWTLRESLGWSLNVVFAQIGLQLGAGGLRQGAAAWGFGEGLPYDLPVTPSRVEVDPDFLDAPIAVAETAFGQGQLLATPLQMALVAAGVGAGGAVPRPFLVEAMLDATGEQTWRAGPSTWRRPVRPEPAAAVAEMMEWAVADGGIRAAAVPGARVGGKTGTAETGDGRQPHGWFIGYAEAGDRLLAVAVVLEHAGGGGAVALPVGQTLLEAGLAV